MFKVFWDLLFRPGSFFNDNAREKLVICFSFIIALVVLFLLKEKGLELVGVIIGGYFAFLKGDRTPDQIQSYLLRKENEDLKKTIVVEPKKSEVIEGGQE